MQDNWKSAVQGRSIKGASSSLTEFSCQTDGEFGLVVRATDSNGSPRLQIQTLPNEELPQDSDAVCRVDWSWIVNSRIAEMTSSSSALRLQMTPAGPLAISVGTWQGKPFLSFQPYKAPPV